MSNNRRVAWEALERWNSTAFLIGGMMFVVAAGFNFFDVLGGAGHTRLPLKQAFISAGWFAALIGLSGMYPALADRSRWLIRAGAICIAIGLVGFSVMGGISLAVYAGILQGGLRSYALIFLPPVAVGSLLPFLLFSVVILRSDVHSGVLGVFLLGPLLLFIFNLLTPSPPTVVLAVVTGLALVCFGVGYILRIEVVQSDRTESATTPTMD